MIRLCAALACGYLAANILVGAFDTETLHWRLVLMVSAVAWIVIAALVVAGHAGRPPQYRAPHAPTPRERLRVQVMRGVQ